jgi:hypothetical protein
VTKEYENVKRIHSRGGPFYIASENKKVASRKPNFVVVTLKNYYFPGFASTVIDIFNSDDMVSKREKKSTRTVVVGS